MTSHMKTSLTRFILIISVISLMTACHMESSDNGHLDGFWHLVRVDTLSIDTLSIDTLSIVGTSDLSQDYFFWAFQFQLLSVRNTQKSPEEYFLRFQRQGDELVLSQPFQYVLQGKDAPVENIDLLRPFGINDQEERFRIVHLSSRRMTLQNNFLVLTMQKL